MAEEIITTGEAEDIVPVVDVQAALASWNAYQDLCRQLLDNNDYAVIRGRKARKRSGWAKLRRFLGVSVEVMEERYWEQDDDWGFDFLVKASLPNGRSEVADGSCAASELRGSNIAPTRHNVRAKALTRAKNRATADLIGGGEVSAEELEAPPPTAHEANNHNWSWFWATLRARGYTPDQVHEALGCASVKDWLAAQPGRTLQQAMEIVLAQ